MTGRELVQLGREIVQHAQARGLTLRLYGGVAIYARCPSIETHPSLQRPYADIDLITAPDAWEGLPSLLAARGFAMHRRTPTRMTWQQEQVTIDIRQAKVRNDFLFDLAPRLNITPLTLPLADLLLLELAHIQFVEKHIQDACALLLDHRVMNDGDEDQVINREYLHRVVNQNYRLWKTVFDNTVTLEQVFDRYLEPEEAQLAWRRVELIQEVLDGKPHSWRWWMGRFLDWKAGRGA